MIKLDISTILFLYLLLSVVGILAAWFFLNFGTKMKMFSPDEKSIWHCSICSNNYIDSRNDELSECPRCGSYNQREDAVSVTPGGRSDVESESN